MSEEEIERRAEFLFDPDDELLFEWQVHLLATRKRTTTRLVLAMIVILTVGFFWDGLIWVPLALIFILVPSATYVFPTSYILTKKGIHLRNLIARDKNRWSRFTSYQVYPDAVQLMFNRKTIRGWILRGNILFFENDDQKERVIDVVSRYLEPENNEAGDGS